MTHTSRIFAAALIAGGLAAQAPAYATPSLNAPTAETAGAGTLLAMGPGVGMRCTIGSAAVATPADTASSAETEAADATAINPRALPKRNACQTVPQDSL